MVGTKWWKCDLQVATPAWNFHLPAGSNYDFHDPQERIRFLDIYMQALLEKGIEVIALADHNTGEWIDVAKDAGKKHGIVVFPGCEITTHTGADGVHLIIIGETDKTSRDFDRLIFGCLGFDHDHPPFLNQDGGRLPGTSSKTLLQILDALPDGYLAIAPHALNDNGIASKNTVRGEMRWKALHHERLVAIDPGNCASIVGDSFNSRLRRRELDDFPRLRDLAFVSTSDAYSLEQVGSRYTWLRMGAVSIEGLRQAYLDHESRVICDWSPALNAFPERNPNNVRHAWVSSVTLGGHLSNSSSTVTVPFHSNLNVIIGGRGSGKSSVVSALRQIYSSTNGLPSRLKDEADHFVDNVFAKAELGAIHRIQESQQTQHSTWTRELGSTVLIDSERVKTSFPVTVISQKELFERAAGDKNDPHSSSRSLLALVDGSIGYNISDLKSIDGFGRQLEDARVEWTNAVRELTLMQSDLAQLPQLRNNAIVLQGQVDAFSSAEVKQRLARIRARKNERDFIDASKTGIERAHNEVLQTVDKLMQHPPVIGTLPGPYQQAYEALISQLRECSIQLANGLSHAVENSRECLYSFERQLLESSWQKDAIDAHEDFKAYKQELQEKGLSTIEFNRLQEELNRVREKIEQLENREPEIITVKARTDQAWQTVIELIRRRRSARQALLDQVHQRSGRLRFKYQLLSDVLPWISSFRSTAGFRADAFLDDVPTVAEWLWKGSAEEVEQRWVEWKTVLATGNMAPLQKAIRLRSIFFDRLSGLDENVRLRLATLVPDDVVMMEFLREHGSAECDEDWQSITQGSPGQRTAAMLAFVLHHGREPLVLDQPEDDLDSEWISKLVVKELRQSRWHRQLIVVSHNANIPVLGDAEQVIALENKGGSIAIKTTEVADEGGGLCHVPHIGPVENYFVRNDIQVIMEGGVAAFVRREQKYNNETKVFKGNA